MENLSDLICHFYTILQRTNTAIDKLRLRYPPPITNFMSYTIEVHKETEVAINEKSTFKQGQVG